MRAWSTAAIWLLALAAAGQVTTGASSLPMEREMLAAHNSVRARRGIPPLYWSDRLALTAHDWAAVLIARDALVHRPNSRWGENLYEIRGALATPAEVVEAWAGEARDYDYASNTCRGVCGHFTQVVWSDTREVGCASARGPNREVWVCEYDPPGNWMGKKPW
jgi:uncharacterized protein YkwD